MLVNGKVWPFLDVEPRMYRFRVLNGCNARILNLNLGGAPLWQIGAEGGMWDMPVPVKKIALAPAERADLVIDFSKMAGQTLTVGNSNPPKPISTPAPSLSQVMQIRVGTTVTQPGPTTIPASLPGRAADLPAPGPDFTRYITLNEINAETADWFLDLNGLHFDAARHREPEGRHHRGLGVRQPHRRHAPDALTPGHLPSRRAHPLRRRGVPGGIRRTHRRARRHRPDTVRHRTEQPPEPTERGFKDTVKANPGYLTTIRAKIRTAGRRDRAADLRLPLPHRRTRGQRHDAPIHRRTITVTGHPTRAALSPVPASALRVAVTPVFVGSGDTGFEGR